MPQNAAGFDSSCPMLAQAGEAEATMPQDAAEIILCPVLSTGFPATSAGGSSSVSAGGLSHEVMMSRMLMPLAGGCNH
jgi:hypothetical protein